MFGKAKGEQAQATVAQVKMTERRSYGEAKVRITYLIEPAGAPAFEVIRETRVRMKYLPQAGQRVQVRYDPAKQELLEVLTSPGAETPPPPGSEPTQEIPWNDSGHSNWWANDTRRS